MTDGATGMIILGIDPGATGGIAAVSGTDVVALLKRESSTEDDIVRFLAAYSAATAYLEDPRGVMPGLRTPKSISGPAESFGLFRGILAALKIERHFPRPMAWQKGFNLPKRVDVGDTAKKRAHRERAEQLFPRQTVTNWNADALLIAYYGHRREAERKLPEAV